MNLYQENILDHYRHPRNKGRLEGADLDRREANPLCGDVIEIFVKFQDGKAADVSFEGEGCAISMASASMLTEELKGKTAQEILGMGRKEIIGMLGVDPGATRIKCATLALKAVHLGVAEKYSRKEEGKEKGNADEL